MLFILKVKSEGKYQNQNQTLPHLIFFNLEMKLNSPVEEQVKTDDTFPKILCSYTNSTPYLQIIKLMNSKFFELERVLFPQQRLMFTADPEAQLEITTCQNGFPGRPERIACDRLEVQVAESRSYRESVAF